MITKFGAAAVAAPVHKPFLFNVLKYGLKGTGYGLAGAGIAGIWLAKNLLRLAAGTGKLLYGGPKRCMVTVPATITAIARGEDYFTAPQEYINPLNNRYQLDDSLFLRQYTKGPDYERYTRIC